MNIQELPACFWDQVNLCADKKMKKYLSSGDSGGGQLSDCFGVRPGDDCKSLESRRWSDA